MGGWCFESVCNLTSYGFLIAFLYSASKIKLVLYIHYFFFLIYSPDGRDEKQQNGLAYNVTTSLGPVAVLIQLGVNLGSDLRVTGPCRNLCCERVLETHESSCDACKANVNCRYVKTMRNATDRDWWLGLGRGHDIRPHRWTWPTK